LYVAKIFNNKEGQCSFKFLFDSGGTSVMINCWVLPTDCEVFAHSRQDFATTQGTFSSPGCILPCRHYSNQGFIYHLLISERQPTIKHIWLRNNAVSNYMKYLKNERNCLMENLAVIQAISFIST
jgi:hypothetical protein